MADGAKPVWLFYHLQNERGEEAAHPNACKLSPAAAGRVTLQDVLNAFPLAGTGAFHFRFQVAQDKSIMFLDVLGPGDVVPTVGGNVVAKVLRLGASHDIARGRGQNELPGARRGARCACSTPRTHASPSRSRRLVLRPRRQRQVRHAQRHGAHPQNILHRWRDAATAGGSADAGCGHGLAARDRPLHGCRRCGIRRGRAPWRRRALWPPHQRRP
jgi:hypothetical protein